MNDGPNRPALRYYGGKWILAPWIISHFPAHKVYVEPFGGAASVLLRKKRAYAEIYNDLDQEVVGLFRILRNPAAARELEHQLRLTPFARDEFDESYSPTDDPIETARRLIIRSFMGFGGDGHNVESGRTGFRANSNRSGSTPAHDWCNFPDEIKAFTDRLTGVVIENRDAAEVMHAHDSPETLHFVDPPYVHHTRGKIRGYKYEMDDTAHRDMIDQLKAMKGMVVLCGYDSPLYSALDWETVDRDAFADGALKRRERLWLNPACARAQSQLSLFMGAE